MRTHLSTIFVGLAIAFFVVALQEEEKETLQNFVFTSLISVPLYILLSAIVKKAISIFLWKRGFHLVNKLGRKELEQKLEKETKILLAVLALTSMVITIFLTKILAKETFLK